MDKLTHYMSIIKKQCHSFMTEELKDLDISGAEAPFIKYLSQHPNCRQTDLSKAFDCDKSHTHRIISKLIEKKIISQAEQSNSFSLTDKGKSMVATINKTTKKWIDTLCYGISKEEEQIALSILKKCADNACQLKTETKND